jgi:cytochrome c oxidase assembly protein subunit 11
MSATPGSTPDRSRRPSAKVTAFVCVAVVAGMVGLSFAAVPLYTLFCQVTGFGGTTQRADGPADRVLDRKVTIRFDANTGNGLDWRFRPMTRQVTLRVGETGEAIFRAENTSGVPLAGTATFNVTPEQVGIYFTKIACFCFTEQTLQPGEALDMPVIFYVDPAIAEDGELDYIRTITLSYTFFPVERRAPAPVAALGAEQK